MSIKIDKDKCVGCRKCIEICPGSLIKLNEKNKAVMKYEDRCWGCSACLKECNFNAIRYYLGADIGGDGSYMTVSTEEKKINWKFTKNDGSEVVVATSSDESNKY